MKTRGKVQKDESNQNLFKAVYETIRNFYSNQEESPLPLGRKTDKSYRNVSKKGYYNLEDPEAKFLHDYVTEETMDYACDKHIDTNDLLESVSKVSSCFKKRSYKCSLSHPCTLFMNVAEFVFLWKKMTYHERYDDLFVFISLHLFCDNVDALTYHSNWDIDRYNICLVYAFLIIRCTGYDKFKFNVQTVNTMRCDSLLKSITQLCMDAVGFYMSNNPQCELILSSL